MPRLKLWRITMCNFNKTFHELWLKVFIPHPRVLGGRTTPDHTRSFGFIHNQWQLVRYNILWSSGENLQFFYIYLIFFINQVLFLLIAIRWERNLMTSTDSFKIVISWLKNTHISLNFWKHWEFQHCCDGTSTIMCSKISKHYISSNEFQYSSINTF